MHIGKLDKRIEVQVRTEGQNTYGEPEETWTTVVTTYANIKPLVGKDFMGAKAQAVELTHDITIQFNRKVKNKMRIKYNNRYFDIKYALDPEESHEWLFLKCEELIR